MELIKEIFYLLFPDKELSLVLLTLILIAGGQIGSISAHAAIGAAQCQDSPDYLSWKYFRSKTKNKYRLILGVIVLLGSWLKTDWVIANFIPPIIVSAFGNLSPFFVGLLSDQTYAWIVGIWKGKPKG